MAPTDHPEFGLSTKALKILEPKSWGQLQAILSDDKLDGGIWRGHAMEKWTVESGLERAFKKNVPTNESRMLQRFKADSTQMEPGIKFPSSRFDWLSLMQHYGAPTRLVDWTTSPYVALYFACCHHRDDPGALWRVSRTWLLENSRAYIKGSSTTIAAHRGDPSVVVDYVIDNAVPVAIPLMPSRRFPRMVAQAGLFTLVGGEDARFSEAIRTLAAHSDMRNSGTVLQKVVLSKDLKAEGLRRLRAMNITESTVYPGLEGLARSLPDGDFLDWFYLPGSFGS